MPDRDWRRYNAEHREQRRASGRRYYLAHADERRARQRAYGASNRLRLAADQRRAYALDPTARLETARRYAAEHPDRRQAYARSHLAESAARAHARRARLAGATGRHTAMEWREKIALFGGCCAYCGRSDRPLARDHRVPLFRGGSNGIANIVPACRSCNSFKGTRTDVEFLAIRGAGAAVG